jgi:hypothetical protein
MESRKSMKKIALFSLLTITPALAQQAKFEIADVHVSTTAHGFAQKFGGVLRDGKYINRDATMRPHLSFVFRLRAGSRASTCRLMGWRSGATG